MQNIKTIFWSLNFQHFNIFTPGAFKCVKKLFFIRNKPPPKPCSAILSFHPGLTGIGEDCLQNVSVKVSLMRGCAECIKTVFAVSHKEYKTELICCGEIQRLLAMTAREESVTNTHLLEGCLPCVIVCLMSIQPDLWQTTLSLFYRQTKNTKQTLLCIWRGNLIKKGKGEFQPFIFLKIIGYDLH